MLWSFSLCEFVLVSSSASSHVFLLFFFFNDTATTEIYTLSLHDALPICRNATSLNSRFKSLDTLKVKIISVTFRRVIRTNHKKASKIWRHENIQLGGCQS